MPIVRIDATLEMYYEDDDFTDPWAPAETVVLHHGMAKNANLWYAWVPLLAGDFRVVRLDARGFGRSTVPPPGYPWSLGGFGRDLKRLLDHLGLERVHLIGETVGGTIALQFAYEYPERLKSVTVCTSPFRFAGVPSHLRNRDLVEREGVEAWVQNTIAQRLDPTEYSPAHVEWYMQQMSATQKHVVTEGITALSKLDMSDVIPQIRVPTLIIIGEDSARQETFQPEEMQRLIPGSRLDIIPGASGFVQHSFPEKCVAVWRNFVADLRSQAC